MIVSGTAPVLRAVINNYLKRSGINITPAHEADNVLQNCTLEVLKVCTAIQNINRASVHT